MRRICRWAVLHCHVRRIEPLNMRAAPCVADERHTAHPIAETRPGRMNDPTPHDVSHRPSAESAWTAAREWLVTELRVMPSAAVLDLGPAGHDAAADADADVECAQIHVLQGNVYLVRL